MERVTLQNNLPLPLLASRSIYSIWRLGTRSGMTCHR